MANSNPSSDSIPSKHVGIVSVTDPDTGGSVEVEIRKLATGAMVGLDGPWLEQHDHDPRSPYDEATISVPDDEPATASGRQSLYMPIDLVVRETDRGYTAVGGPERAFFGGSGPSSEAAIGHWFLQNREAANFKVSFIENGKMTSSTIYGIGRSRSQLGPNEIAALQALSQQGSTPDDDVS